MDKLRVMLANMPPILRLILRDLVNRQLDMAVVGEVRTLAELPHALASHRAEAVILTLPPPSTEPAICNTLREYHPALTLLGLALRNDRAVVWPPHTPPQTFQLSAAGILTALRGHVGRNEPH